ncbi:MAG: T9SS C-terminal target domain-containing protein [Bacteroidetes bacterium]|nr:MAG: T9SS C-terminal target domain-containing protein [Bacteroidota bacterium]
MKKALFIFILFAVSLGIAAQTLVYTPALKAPANDATGQMPDVVLSWYAVTGTLNLQYQLQVDTSMNFNTPLLIDVTQHLLTGFQTTNLLFNTKYYWRVRAIDGATSPWSEVWNFTVFNTVIHLKPNNDASSQESNVNLEWRDRVGSIDISGVTYFTYQADTSLGFNSPLLVQGTVAGTVFTGPMQWLRFGAKYYWRVRAGHPGDVGGWSEPWSFTVLDIVSLSSPNNNVVNQVLDVLLKWKAVGGILSYEFEIASDENFNTMVFLGETNEIQVNAEFLMFGNDYWWRVRARHQNDTTGWSDPRKFTSINTVLLKSPSNDQQNVALTPTMMWTAQTGIVEYQLQIATDIGFANIFYDVKPKAGESDIKVTRKMAYNTVYYWRMRAFSNGGALADTTNWSDPWKFTTTNPAGIDDQSAAALAIYPNPASEKAFLKITSKEAADGRCVVMDLLGKTVLEQSFTLKSGENVEELSLLNLRKGIYVVRLTINGETVNQKLIVE